MFSPRQPDSPAAQAHARRAAPIDGNPTGTGDEPPHGLGKLAQALAVEAAGAIGVDRCLVLALRGGRLVPLSEPPLPHVRLSRVAAALRVFTERQPVLVEARGLPPGWATAGSQTVLLVPLLRNAHRLGLLLFAADGRDLGELEAKLAGAIARPIVRGLRLASASQRATARLRAARTLLRVSRNLQGSLELREVMACVAREAARAVRADSTGIYVLNETGQSLELIAAHHTREELPGARAVSVDAVSALNGVPAWSVEPALQQEAFWQSPASARLLAPLRAGSELVGLLVCAWWERPRRPSPHAVRLIEAVAGEAAVALANARRYARAEAQAVDRERTRVDAVLHDTLNQTLFSLGLKVEIALGMTRRPSRLRSTLEAIKRDTIGMSGQIRQLVSAAPEPTAVEAAPPDRLIRVIQEFRELTGVPVVLIEAGPSPRLGPRQLDVLIMIVQAGLASLAPQSGATRAEIRLDATGDRFVRFAVTGTGSGWSGEPDGTEFPPTGIVERIRVLGGRLEVMRTGPSGFCLSGVLPLAEENDAEDSHRRR